MRRPKKLTNHILKYYQNVLSDLGTQAKFHENINGFLYYKLNVDGVELNLRLISQYKFFGQYFKPNGTLYSAFSGLFGIAEAVVDLDICDHALVVRSCMKIITDIRRSLGSETKWISEHNITQI